ncbi:MAG: hypothetical protein Q9181_003321 [Wetmoreana brouardii]
MDLIRTMEQEWTQRFNGTTAYDKILQVYAKNRDVHEEDPEFKNGPDKPSNDRTDGHADDDMLSTYTILREIQEAIKPGTTVSCQFGRPGDRDTTTKRFAKFARVSLHSDRSILLEDFSDLHNIMVCCEGEYVFEDNLMRGIRDMAPGREILVWHLLAAQIFLDIQHILEDDLGRGQAELTQTATAMKATIEENFDFHSSLRISTWPKENDAVWRDLLAYIGEVILQDFMTKVSAKVEHSLLQQTILKVRFQELSIAFANAWPSVISTAHLYNAVRKERLLKTEWKDLELVMKLQGAETLFVGDRPNKVKDYHNRYRLSIGISATMFARNKRQNLDWARAKRGTRAMRGLGPVANLFRGRYVDNEASVALTWESIEPLVQTEPGKHPKTSTKGKQAVPRAQEQDTKGNSQSFPMVSFLDKIVNLVDKEQLAMSVDYLHMHRASFRLVRRVKEAFNTKLGTRYGDVFLKEESRLPFVVGVILWSAETMSHATSLLRLRRTSEAINPALALPGTVMEEFIAEEGCGLAGRLLGEVYGDNVLFEVQEAEAEENSCEHTSAT